MRRVEAPEGHLRTLFDASPDAIFLKDGAGRWLAANVPALTLFDLVGADYQGKTDLELADDSPHLRDAFQACVDSDEAAWAHGSLSRLEEFVPLPSGQTLYFDVIKLPLFHPDGSRKGLVVIGRDITARKNVEQERDRLLAQEQAARTAAELAQRRSSLLAEASRLLAGPFDDASTLDEVARLVVPAFADGCSIELDATEHVPAQRVAVGRNPAEDLQTPLTVPMQAHGHGLGRLTFTSTEPDAFGADDRRLAEDLAQRVSLAVENARLIRELKASHDALAQAQQELVRRERLAALGELAAVVAHEVRNPLGAIFNSIAALRKSGTNAEQSALLLGVVEEEASRLNRIVVDLLDFARPFQMKREEVALSEIVHEAISSAVRAQTSAGQIRLISDVDGTLPPLQADPGLMHLALLNVLSNALQSMSGTGALEVRLRRVDSEARGWAEVSISDTGPGIPEDVLPRVFEPFFTTRASGTGLGLAIVKRIVEGHAGSVEVQSARGRGTTVLLRVPLTP